MIERFEQLLDESQASLDQITYQTMLRVLIQKMVDRCLSSDLPASMVNRIRQQLPI